MDNYLQLDHVGKKFGQFTALEDVTFSTSRAEFVSVLGPSGCGKTTLLRVIAGLEKQDAGRVVLSGRDVSGLPVSQRNVGIVFQSYALFPNLTAAENVAYGLKSRRADRRQINQRVRDLLHLVGLRGLDRKYPAQLSGGQQQRVALARAMALSPDLLLLDEPLSALDAKVRLMLRKEIRLLQRELGVTAIMVTHDQEEALTMADRILVMDRGRVAQIGSPSEIYERPATPFVASFVGRMNFIPNVVRNEDGGYAVGRTVLKVLDGRPAVQAGQSALAAIRPEDVVLREQGNGTANLFRARIEGLEYQGAQYRVTLSLPLGEGLISTLEADISSDRAGRLGLRPDMEMPVHLPEDRIRIYAA